uniref:Uncharacterized protein n=1 Tax=Trichinella nativa TaxID=6335 RepID=A0A0V1KIT8_9BILA
MNKRRRKRKGVCQERGEEVDMTTGLEDEQVNLYEPVESLPS